MTTGGCVGLGPWPRRKQPRQPDAVTATPGGRAGPNPPRTSTRAAVAWAGWGGSAGALAIATGARRGCPPRAPSPAEHGARDGREQSAAWQSRALAHESLSTRQHAIREERAASRARKCLGRADESEPVLASSGLRSPEGPVQVSQGTTPWLLRAASTLLPKGCHEKREKKLRCYTLKWGVTLAPAGTCVNFKHPVPRGEMGEEGRGGKAMLVGPPQSMVRCKMVLYIGLNLAKLATTT